ncbi:hypothetical protein MMC14_009797 [Varicellaria rhodocarpa]|nr:hypothetical protein [Varicellaria rhodocarpa]
MLLTRFPLMFLITSVVAAPLISTVTTGETSEALEPSYMTERGSDVAALVKRTKDKGDSVSLPVRISEDIILRDENSQVRKTT